MNRSRPVLLALICGLIATACGASATAPSAKLVPTPVRTSESAAPSPDVVSEVATVTPSSDVPPLVTTATPPPTADGVSRPNGTLTPGSAFAGATTALICVSGYSKTVRHVARTQFVNVYLSYGLSYPQAPGAYELDHLISLELGGDNTDANLWPEPASPPPGFHEKDVLENRLHALVCAGQLDLTSAQHMVAKDWYGAYLQYR